MSERFKLLTSRGGRLERQATLRATFDWSWDMLSLPEKAALAQLSVFEGGITLAAAEAILDLSAYSDAPWQIDVLQSLLEKSFIRHKSETRFDLLSSVQEYALEHLRTAGRYAGSGPSALAAAQARHYAHFAGLGGGGAVVDACADLDNLVAACRRAALDGNVQAAVGSLEGAWAAIKLRGPFILGVELATMVRAMPGLGQDSIGRVDRVAGRALQTCGRVADASARFENALLAARHVGDRVCEGYLLSHLADLHINGGRMDEGRIALMAALDLARELGDRMLECVVLSGLGHLHEHLGSLGEARSHYEAALIAAQEVRDRRWEGGCLGSLGLLFANQGKMTEARTHYEAALSVARELGDRQWEGNTLCNLGLMHYVQGKMADAQAALDGALLVARELGHTRLECIALCNLGMVQEALEAPNEALAQYNAALAVARDLGDRRSEGQFLNYLGLLHARQRRFHEARACLDEGEKLLSAVSDRLNLGLLLCSRAEAEFLAGALEAANAAIAAATLMAAAVNAEGGSELGLSLRRVGALLGRSPET